MQKTYLTREGYEKLRKKLEYLKTVRRGELSKEIGIARKHGDLKENSEYDAAKNAQGLNEAKIAELEGKLSNGQIIDYEDIPTDRVLIGAIVELKNLDSGEKIQYTLVSELEADFSDGKISISSPVAQSLLGHKENETVEINVPAGILRYKVLKISR
ncbi:transcription elongation factor GreA [bacterium]|nr:transcription elongation factor GreA [bacterium]